MAAFNTLDADNDGFITKEDLAKALDGQMTEQNVTEMLNHADASGRVNFQTFKKIVFHGLKGAASSPAQHIVQVAEKSCKGNPTRMSMMVQQGDAASLIPPGSPPSA